jgi:hypothetical protein
MANILNQGGNKQRRFSEDEIEDEITLLNDLVTFQLPGTFYYNCSKNTF